MARASAKLMRTALREALELYEHEYCHSDGCVVQHPGGPSVGAQWLMSARAALGLDPMTGKRQTQARAGDEGPLPFEER